MASLGNGFIHINKPLGHYLRFHDSSGPFRRSDIMSIVLFFDEETFEAKFLQNFFSGGLDFQAGKFSRDRQESAVLIYNRLFIQRVSQSDVEINSRVCRRDGHYSCTEFLINSLILNDRSGDRAVYPLKLDDLSVPIHLVSCVLWMHHHILISELSFRSGGSDDKRSILQVIKFGLFFSVH